MSQTIADARGASRNELDFELSEMDDEMAEYVAQALEDDWEQQLQESWFFLEVSFNDFGSRGAVAFAKAIGKQTTHLIEFESFTNHITSAGAVAIAQHCLAVPNCRLGGLNLDHNPIESEGVIALANALATNTTLDSLTLPRWLCRDAAQALGAALRTNSTLRDLSFDTCHHLEDAECVRHLAEGLVHNKGLRTLSMPRCNISDSGFRHLWEALRTNQSLRHLQLHRNNIGDEGMTLIAETLQRQAESIETEDTIPDRSKGLPGKIGKRELSLRSSCRVAV